jgi:hypothetical protein
MFLSKGSKQNFTHSNSKGYIFIYLILGFRIDGNVSDSELSGCKHPRIHLQQKRTFMLFVQKIGARTLYMLSPIPLDDVTLETKWTVGL